MEQYLPLLISAGSLLVAFLAYVRNVGNDNSKEHESLIKMNVKLDQICATTNETRSDIKSMNTSIQEHDKRLTIVERDIKTAFKKIDDINKE